LLELFILSPKLFLCSHRVSVAGDSLASGPHVAAIGWS
jgi:hypothetical protein